MEQPVSSIPSEYEKSLAKAIAERPDLICLDVRLFFSRGLWIDKEPIEEFDYSDNTYHVLVVFISLYSEEERRRFGRNFKMEKAFNIYTSKAEIIPTLNDFIVDDFPITEQSVLSVCKRFLSATEYANEKNEFLFGPVIYEIR